MNRSFLSGIFIGLVILAGCLQLADPDLWLSEEKKTVEVEKGPALLDCGEDLGCLIEASEGCRPAKADHVLESNFFGVKQRTVNYYEIKGNESGRCVLYNRLAELDVTYPETMDKGAVEQAKASMESLEGKDQTCRFPEGRLTKLLRNMKKGIFSSSDWEGADCTGSMYEYGTVVFETDPSGKAASLEPAEPVALTCPDGYSLSDGVCQKDGPYYSCTGPSGIDIYTKESSTYKEGEYQGTISDFCKDSDTVVDYYCSDGRVKPFQVNCPNGYGCSDGACVNTDYCSGSSNRGSVYEKTYRYVVSGSSSRKYGDYCQSSGTVQKAYCDGDGVGYMPVDCPSGYSCSDGACVEDPGTSCSGPDSYSLYSQNTIWYYDGDDWDRHSDYCVDGDSAKKYYCDGDGYRKRTASCPNGYSCVDDGVCTKDAPSASASGGCSGSSCGTGGSTSTGGSGTIQISEEEFREISKRIDRGYVDYDQFGWWIE